MTNVTALKTKKVKVELVSTNVYTRWRCYACGGRTEKVSVLAEVPDGSPCAGFRVCEQCLRTGDVGARMREHAARLREEADLLIDLAPQLEVPSWRDYLLAELHHDADVVRAFDHSPAEEAARVLGNGVGEGAQYYSAVTEADVLQAFGVTREQVGTAQFAMAKRKKAAERATCQGDDVAF